MWSLSFVTLRAPHHLSSRLQRRPRSCPRNPPAVCQATRFQAIRTTVGAVDATELKRLAEVAESRTESAATCVLALHSDARGCELLELGPGSGEHKYNLAWPPAPPVWPFCPIQPPPSSSSAPNTKPAHALVASTRAISPEHAQIVRARTAAMLRDSIACGDLLAGVVLVDTQDPAAFLVFTVHDPDADSGACFDPELAGAEWAVKRYAAVYPPLAAWRAYDAAVTAAPVDAKSAEISVAASRPSTPAPPAPGTSVQRADPHAARRPAEGPGDVARASDFAPKARLRYGSGSLDGLAILMRDVSAAEDGEPLRIFIASGWNESRIQPLNIECEAPFENGHLTYVIGTNVYAASATLQTLRDAVETARITNPHIITGFGGGAVMDGAKALGALVAQPDAVVDAALEQISAAAERAERETTIRLACAPLPAVLVPGTIGAGAELCDAVLLVAQVGTGAPGERTRRHSLLVTFDYESSVSRRTTERTAVVDPRIVSPRRLNGADAAQGGLLALVSALDSLLHARASPQAAALANDALQHASDSILCARREPSTGDGESRDALVRATSAAALARDAVGPGIGLLLTLAVIDSIRDGPVDGEFRQIYVRIIASVVRRACCYPVLAETLGNAASIVTGDMYAVPPALANWIIMRAEDIGVPQMSEIGVRCKRAVQNVRALAASGAIRHPPHPDFHDADLLADVVEDAIMNQPYDL